MKNIIPFILCLFLFSCGSESTDTVNTTPIAKTEPVAEKKASPSPEELAAAAAKVEEDKKAADAAAAKLEKQAAEEAAKVQKEKQAAEEKAKKAAAKKKAADKKKAEEKRQKAAAANAAKFEFMGKGTDHKYGWITEGDVVSHEFEFKNVGKQPLIIQSADAACGCTLPEYPLEPTPPGGTAKIKVTFDSKGKVGTQNKKVTIVANTVPKYSYLWMKGAVLK